VSDEVAPHLGELTVEVLPVETVLRGEIVDQAALHGLLDQVQALGLELIELRSLGRTPRHAPQLYANVDVEAGALGNPVLRTRTEPPEASR
jgi:hypothetical protein